MNADDIIKKIRACMPEKEAAKLPEEVAMISLSPAKIRELNRVYREEDAPTNVLSFRYDGKYGEILVCPAVIRREAKAGGNSFQHQMTLMVVHGMLHLAGLHHEESATVAKLVKEIEAKIMDKLFAK